MYKIEYNIELNETGRPCIGLPDGYEHRPEDKFFAIEIARYLIQQVFERRSAEFDERTSEVLINTITILGQVGDEMAEIQYDNMRALGEMSMMINDRYHIFVSSIEDRDNLPDKNILINGKIFDRVEGLRVGVNDRHIATNFPTYQIYELKDGISNDNWVKI